MDFPTSRDTVRVAPTDAMSSRDPATAATRRRTAARSTSSSAAPEPDKAPTAALARDPPSTIPAARDDTVHDMATAAALSTTAERIGAVTRICHGPFVHVADGTVEERSGSHPCMGHALEQTGTTLPLLEESAFVLKHATDVVGGDAPDREGTHGPAGRKIREGAAGGDSGHRTGGDEPAGNGEQPHRAEGREHRADDAGQRQ